jgi:tol-pal system protein YbgF
MLTAGVLAAAGLGLGGCVSGQDIEGLRTQISDVQRQVLAVQKQSSSKEEIGSLSASFSKQMDALLKTEADMQVRLQDLSTQIESLKAKLEDTNFRLATLSQQIASNNQEMKSYRGESGAAPPAGAPATAPPPAAPPPAAAASDPQALYNSAYNDYLKGSYDLAMRGFREYLETFPSTSLAANATYWIGECYYRQKRFRQAIDQYDAVLSRYPRSDKAASAMLKKGYAHLELGERAQGVVQLQHVLRQYPVSDEANLARQRLRELGVDGA